MDTKTKLQNRPIEGDTQVLLQTFIQFQEFTALFENWKWESIKASSIIYLKDDARDAIKEELIKSLFSQMQLPIDQKMTYKETGEYIFINFGFVVG